MKTLTKLELVAKTIAAVKTPAEFTTTDFENLWKQLKITPDELYPELEAAWNAQH